MPILHRASRHGTDFTVPNVVNRNLIQYHNKNLLFLQRRL